MQFEVIETFALGMVNESGLMVATAVLVAGTPAPAGAADSATEPKARSESNVMKIFMDKTPPDLSKLNGQEMSS